MKRWMVAGLSAAMGMSLLLSACAKDEAAPASGEAGAVKVDASRVTAAGELPITKEKTNLKIMVKAMTNVEDYATNEYTKWLEEKTNIHIEWEVVQDKSAQEKLNVALASGDYPDVIMNFNISPVQQALYGKEGVFLPLNSYIDQFGVETNKMFKEADYVKSLITMPDGNIYGLPLVNECFHCSLGQKMWIYQPWLDKLGLPLPTTTDEFYQVLKAFKEKDPNGNGKADEIPLAGYVNGATPSMGAASNIDSHLLGSFVEKDTNSMFVKDGKVQLAYTQPGWRDGLIYLNKLYSEGLIAQQTFTQDRNQLKQMGENPDAPILGVAIAQNQTMFINSAGPRFKEYVAVPPLKGPAGIQSAAYNPFAVSNGNYVITDKAKNPEAAFRLADFMYTEENALRGTIGRQDKEWAWAEPGEKGIDGQPARWKQLGAPTGTQQNVHWGQANPSYRSNKFRLSQMADPKNPLEIILYNETKMKYEPYKIAVGKIVPPLFFSSEQAEELAGLTKTINDYRTETLAKAITGKIDIAKEWDNYLKTLDSMKVTATWKFNRLPTRFI
ncbi:ABC transporter substrate-binding protein [Paenibacillus sp. TAB 01]|uniref:ABC transporter substrate-binding protein n=1 Tax=Paenibacillus sp. TAB 01 TaxID=3368988 RepID=UPI0037507EFF